MIIEYEGTPYQFDLDELTVKQALKIEKHIGGPLIEFEKGMAAGNLTACQALGWLILTGGDLATPIGDVDFKLARLLTAFEEASKAEAEAKAAANGERPTPAGASTGRKRAPASSPSA